jgi:hypothetical protein
VSSEWGGGYGAGYGSGVSAGVAQERLTRRWHLCPGCHVRLPARLGFLWRPVAAPTPYSGPVVCPRCLTASRPGPASDIDAGRVRLGEALPEHPRPLTRAERHRAWVAANNLRWEAERDR